MTELSKIQRVSEQWNISVPVLANTWHGFVINKETLNMPVITGIATNEKLPTTGANYDVAYLVKVNALSIISGIVGANGAKSQIAGLSWSNTYSELLPTPLPVSQTNDVFVNSNYFNIYIIGHTNQIPPMSGSPSITNNEINVLIRTLVPISKAKFKLFIEIFAFGDNTI
jgi:hypothetical protein